MKITKHSSRFIEMFGDGRYRNVRLGDYTDLTWGDTNTTKNSYVEDGYLAFSAGGPDGKLDHYDYDREGIVLSAIGADCGKTWFAEGKWSCIKNTIRFWSTSNDLDNYFLYLATRDKEFWPRKGGAQPFIPQGDARNCVIPLPPLILQQLYIALAKQADKSKFSGLKSRFIEITKSRGCKWFPLNSFVEIERKSVNPIKGIMYTLYSFPAYDNALAPEFVDGEEIRSSKLLLTANTILYNKLNVRLRRVWNIRGIESINSICSSEFIPLKVDESIVIQEYLKYFLTSDVVTELMEKASQGTSNSQQRISPRSLLEIDVPVAPILDQNEFIRIFKQSDKSKYLS